jgi:hypothetical protein
VCSVDLVAASPWYARLRAQWRPDPVRVLLVAESVPDPGASDRRFFYAPTLTRSDNLFRGVVLAFYGCSPGTAGDPKEPWLRRLRDDGVYLVDLVPYPVNSLGSSARRRAHRENTGALVETALALDPGGIIVCHRPTYRAVSGPLRRAGLRLLHDQPIPFPTGNWRERFALDVRAASARLVR